MGIKPFVLNLIIQDEQLLLAHKKSGFGAGKIVVIGGKVKRSETLQSAIYRETLEETSLRVSQTELRAELEFYFIPTQTQLHFFVFMTKHFSGQPQESTEVIPHWYPLDNLPFAQMWPDARYWLPPVLGGRPLKATFVYSAHDALQDIQLSESR